ncbi:MAG: hypothetical protein ACXWOL_17555 [Ktedonobacteraceae bacterium]
MRAAAAAIVFILGAAVILVLANSLNSWVLGGLIGGLAALLISIPISVMLFTILSRRHDLKLQALHEELGEMGYVAPDEHGYEAVYETDAYVLPDEEYYNQNVHRRMTDVHALPAAGQSYATSQAGRRSSQALPQGRLKGTPTRDLSAERHTARRSRHEVNAMRSRFQTAALQAARREALHADDVEVLPNHSRVPQKNIPPGQASRSSKAQSGSSRQARPESDLSRQQQTSQKNVSRRSLEPPTGKQNPTRRPQSSAELHTTARTPQTDSLHMDDLHSDTFRMRSPNPETENLRVHPQTGQITRNPQLGQSLRNPDMMTGNLKTPLVRRAPYLYDDDPLREELAQQIDEEPIVRRSSRHLYIEDTD